MSSIILTSRIKLRPAQFARDDQPLKIDASSGSWTNERALHSRLVRLVRTTVAVRVYTIQH